MFKILVLSIVLVSCIDSIKSIESKYWLTTCRYSNCYLTFDVCLNCFGERGCKNCITFYRPDCSVCADDIYNKNDLEIIGGNEYFICDSSESFQVKACHLYCRGQFFQSGQCVRVQNLPVCQCLMDNQIFPTGSTGSTSTTTATTRSSTSTQIQTTTASPSTQVHNFNGTLELNISVTENWQRVFPLSNGDLVRGSRGTTIQIWDIQNGIIKRNLTSAYFRPFVFDVLSNGDLVAGYYKSKTILIWDLNVTQGDPLKRIIQTNETFWSLVVLKNDDLVIGQGDANYDIVIRDSQNGQVKKRLVGHTNSVYQILILPNENLVSCSWDATVKIWNTSNSEPLKSIAHSTWINSIAILKNGNLVSGLEDGTIEIRNLETGDLIRVLSGHSDAICGFSCLHVLDNGNLLSGSHDTTFKVWNPYDGSVLMTSKSHGTIVVYTVFLPNGELVTTSWNEICIWK